MSQSKIKERINYSEKLKSLFKNRNVLLVRRIILVHILTLFAGIFFGFTEANYIFDLKEDILENYKDVFNSGTDIAEPVNSVLNFGADITGNTDSTDAIAEAINNYDEIYFPEGKYLMSKPLEIEKATKWIGKNAEIILDDSQYNGESIQNPSTYILKFNNNIDLEGITFICQSYNDENYADGETLVENYKYARTSIKVVGGTEHKIKNCNFYITEAEGIAARINSIWFQFDKITNNEENEENRTIRLENCYISNKTTGWDTGEGCFWVTGNAKSVDTINCTFERNNVGDAVVFWGWPNATNVEGEAQKQKIEDINIEGCVFNLTDEKNEMGAAALNFGNEANGTEYSTINIKNTDFNVGKGFKRPCIGTSSCSGKTIKLENCNFVKNDCTYSSDETMDFSEYFRLFYLPVDDVKVELNNCKIINPYTETNLSEGAFNIRNSSKMKFTNCEISTRTHINSYNDSLFEGCTFRTRDYDPNDSVKSKIALRLGNWVEETKKDCKNNSTELINCTFYCQTKIYGNISATGCTFKSPVNISFSDDNKPELMKDYNVIKNDNIKIRECTFNSECNIETKYVIENIWIQDNTFLNHIKYSIKDNDNKEKTKTFKDLNIKIDSNGQEGNINETGIEQKFVNENVKCKIQIEMIGEILKNQAKEFYYEEQKMKDQEIEIYANEDIATIDPVTLDLIMHFKKGDLITTIKTDDKGTAELVDLYIGKYIVKEKIKSSEYLSDKTKFNIDLIENEDGEGSTEILKINKVLKKGNLQINIVTENNEAPITNSIVKIYNENNEHIFSGQTDNNGKVFVNGLKVGKYYITQTENISKSEINQDRAMVEINENNETIELIISNNKEIENIKYINEIPSETQINELKEYIQIDAHYTIVDNEGNTIDSEELIKTGYKIKMDDGREYVLVVNADLNGDGRTDKFDLAMITSFVVGREDLDTICKIAGNFNKDNKVDITDLSILSMAITKNIKL